MKKIPTLPRVLDFYKANGGSKGYPITEVKKSDYGNFLETEFAKK